MTRSPFDALVDAYDTARPSYPDALYDAIAAATGPWQGATVVEIGAGTGIATRAMRARGARVVPLDIGEQMLRRLRHHAPDQPVVVARAEALPVRDAIADLVCAAQAWHWVELDRAVPEVVRVLRPGGALAVWWNDVAAAGTEWYEAQQQRLEAMNPGYTRDYRSGPADTPLRSHFRSVEVVRMSWERTLPLEDYMVWLRSKSYVAALRECEAEFLDAERASLLRAFPDGNVTEPFEVRLVLATDPS